MGKPRITGPCDGLVASPATNLSREVETDLSQSLLVRLSAYDGYDDYSVMGRMRANER